MVTPFKPDSMEVDYERLDGPPPPLGCSVSLVLSQQWSNGTSPAAALASSPFASPARCTTLRTTSGSRSAVCCCLMIDLRAQMAERVYSRVAGRCTVVASGTFGGTIEDQAAFCNKMAPFCDAVVVIVCNVSRAAGPWPSHWCCADVRRGSSRI